ncbi:MAG: transposase, partial [Pseudomonadota bacterium]
SRYLYRGVIRERDLVDYDATAGTVTFRYRDGQTQKTAYRTLPIADFLWRLLLHVLPTGFRRVRDYGFLHGKAKLRLALVQLVLRVMIQMRTPPSRPAVCCPLCQSPMRIVAVRTGRRPDG